MKIWKKKEKEEKWIDEISGPENERFKNAQSIQISNEVLEAGPLLASSMIASRAASFLAISDARRSISVRRDFAWARRRVIQSE